MRIADDPDIDYKAIVRRGYDQCASAYHGSRRAEAGSELNTLSSRLDDGASVLDIGCGAGVPTARALARRFSVTGVDISDSMIEFARANVPRGVFIRSDIMSVEFAPSTFDGAVAFYSIFHIPREDHSDLFRRVHNWLKAGGYLLCTLTHYSEEAYTEDDFFGSTMYWSNYGMDDYERILSDIGFDLLDASVIGHGYTEASEGPPERHPLVLARKREMPQ